MYRYYVSSLISLRYRINICYVLARVLLTYLIICLWHIYLHMHFAYDIFAYDILQPLRITTEITSHRAITRMLLLCWLLRIKDHSEYTRNPAFVYFSNQLRKQTILRMLLFVCRGIVFCLRGWFNKRENVLNFRQSVILFPTKSRFIYHRG